MFEHLVAINEAVELAGNGSKSDKPRAVALARAYNYSLSPWWSFQCATNDDTEFFVFGTIGNDANQLIGQMANFQGALSILINCPGGDTLAALKIGRWLAARGNCTGIVTGRCQSAANLILAGCQKRIMRADAGIMLHAVRMAVCDTAPKLRASADQLEGYVTEAAGFLAGRSGQTFAQVIAWLTGPSVDFTAAEALDLGLVHSVTPAIQSASAEPQPAIRTGLVEAEAYDDRLAYELARALAGLKIKDEETIRKILCGRFPHEKADIKSRLLLPAEMPG